MTQRDVANNVLIALSSSSVVTNNLWPDPKTGVNYPIAVQTPQYWVDSIDQVMQTPMPGVGRTNMQLLSNMASIERGEMPAVVSHQDVAPSFDVLANVQDRDLGSVSDELSKVVAQLRPNLPPGTKLQVRGQVDSMNTAFLRLGWGMLFAALFVYFIMVVNFQSWTDPFIIITALPGALCGIAWMLFLTGTTFSVPSLMGAIMSLGVATANSILLVSFANEQLREGKSAIESALAAGYTRLRPVIMTAAAMIIGMVPMALGLGEGGEQNAPLGRAVIGGLLLATLSTLIFVPVIFSMIRGRASPAPVTAHPPATLPHSGVAA
jgi:multidrug efflux pump subunit AcrB